MSASGEGSVADPSPTFVDSVTPSGIEVRYHWAPKRKYELRGAGMPTGPDLARHVEPDWREVPSVTTVLDCLNKPGLTWWGMKMGVQGLITLHNEHKRDLLVGDTVQDLIDLLTEHKLTVNHQRDKAGDRGVNVHDAFETWCKLGHIPDPTMFSEEEAGYVAGIVKFLRDVRPEPQAAEVMVGSLEHGYAGRYDARLYVPLKCEVVYKHTPKRGDHRAVLAPGTILCDLKTSAGIYPSHSRQLEAYEQASVECGYGPSDARGILHVTAEGNYEFVRSTAVFEDFRVVLDVWKSEQAMKARKKR